MPPFPRRNALMPPEPQSSGSEWTDRVVPEPHLNSLGRVIDPSAIIEPETHTGLAATDFAEFLRRYYLPRQDL